MGIELKSDQNRLEDEWSMKRHRHHPTGVALKIKGNLMKKIQWKRVSSLSMMLLAAVLTLTGIALFIAPQGRIALWHDWRLLGLGKEDYEGIHITGSLLFILMGWLHTYYNWRPIKAYLKDKARRMNGLNKEFLVSFALSAIFVASALTTLSPIYQVIVLGDTAKAAWEENLGAPPFGHAENSSLKAIATWMRIDQAQATATLRNAGLRVEDPRLTLKVIAAENGTAPSALFALLDPTGKAKIGDEGRSEQDGLESSASESEGKIAGAGLGHLTLTEFSQRESTDLCNLVARLRKEGVDASPDTDLKTLAGQMDLTPFNVKERLLESTN